MASPRDPVPDLLKRFVATPFKLLAHGCSIETNDVGLLEPFDESRIDIPVGFQIRIVRDGESVPMPTHARVICTATSCLLLAGGTVVMIDRQERRAFAFVSPETTAEKLAQHYLPLALHHEPGHDQSR